MSSRARLGVHVHAGAGSALNHVDGEELEVLAVDELLAGLYYCVLDLVADQTELVVGLDGSHLHDTEGLDELRIVAEMIVADIKVLNASQSLDAEKGLSGNFLVSEQVMFGAGLARNGKFKLYHYCCCVR